MNHKFLAASICGLVLGVLVPPLLPFAIVGVVIGAAPSLLRWAKGFFRWTGRHPVWAVVSSAGLVIVAISGLFILLVASVSFNAGDAGKEKSRIVVEATYLGAGVHHDDPERLVLSDRFRIFSSSFLHTAKQLRTSPFGGRSRQTGSHQSTATLARRLAEGVKLGLEGQGWRARPPSNESIVFTRRREVPLQVSKMPPETPYTIKVPRPAGITSLNDRYVDLRLAPTSRIELTAPERTFGNSFPEGSRQTRPARDLEVLSIPGGAEKVVEVNVRSPWFRNELLVGFADLSILGATRAVFGLLLTALIAFFSDEVKAFLKRIFKRAKKANPTAETN